MMPDFFDLNYLLKGTEIQKRGYEAIRSSGIMETLEKFTPVLVGTLPLDLFTGTSDLDIICCFDDAEQFIDQVRGKLDMNRIRLNDIESLISSFDHHNFTFEIVAQPIPVRQQNAFRHMVAEWTLLTQNDSRFKEKILALKKRGIKTEPAFAQVLGLKGDPYIELLSLK